MKTVLSILAFIGLSGAALAQDMRPALNAESAHRIIMGCRAFAQENDLNLVIAVYDEAGNLKAYLRMDDSPLGSTEVAHWKGQGAANFGRSTGEIGTRAQEFPVFYHAPGFATLRGGVAIRTNDGALLGGVGVSGASGSDDERCAAAGIEAAGLETGLPAETE